MKQTSILTILGLGALAAAAYLYLTPKIIKQKTVIKEQIKSSSAYPPLQVNIPNNASKPPQKDYLGLYARKY